ncbi:MAG: DMT family transporter [Sphingomonadales bacterium]|jgi:drug/metabolite transporter (DMT)-like permease
MNPRLKALTYLHIAVFLWGFTAILGKLISYDSLNLVWHRMLITAAVYFCIPAVWKGVSALSRKDILIFMGIGVIVAMHWLTFYGSIKLGNSASVTLACLGSASFFSAVLDPLINRKPFRMRELLLGLLVIAGILIINYALDTDKTESHHYGAAILTGIISAALAALFTTLNKKHIERASSLSISAIEMLSGALLLSLVFPMLADSNATWIPEFNPQNGQYDLVWILILAIVCTNLTFYLGTFALQELSAFTANLSVNLEPIYGIVLGAIIFNEHDALGVQFYLGASLILISVFIQSFLEFRLRKKQAV